MHCAASTAHLDACALCPQQQQQLQAIKRMKRERTDENAKSNQKASCKAAGSLALAESSTTSAWFAI